MQRQESVELRRRGPHSGKHPQPLEKEGEEERRHEAYTDEEEEDSNPTDRESDGSELLPNESESDGDYPPMSNFEKRLLAETPPLQEEGMPKYSLLLVSFFCCPLSLICLPLFSCT